MIGQRRAREVLQRFPVATFGNLCTALLCHLEEQQVSELFDVIPVVDAVMPQRVTETPELVNDIRHLKTALRTELSPLHLENLR
jgi:hypothetical protein